MHVMLEGGGTVSVCVREVTKVHQSSTVPQLNSQPLLECMGNNPALCLLTLK